MVFTFGFVAFQNLRFHEKPTNRTSRFFHYVGAAV